MRVSEAAAVRVEIAVRRKRRGRAARWIVVHRGTAETAESGTATLTIPRRLVAGRYRITVRGSDAAGNAGRITATRTIRKARGS